MTVAPREQLPTVRGRQTQAAIDSAARAVIARKGILATTISDIAAEAGRSTASFYNYYDSKEAMVHEWAQRFRDEARERALPAISACLLYTSPSPRDVEESRMPSSA